MSVMPKTFVCTNCGHELTPDENETIVVLEAKTPPAAGLGDDPLGIFSRGKDTPDTKNYLITLCPNCRHNNWEAKE